MTCSMQSWVKVFSLAEKPPAFAWVVLTLSVISVSSAGAVFQLIDEVPPLLRASWRLQATSLVLLPFFISQLLSMKGRGRDYLAEILNRRVISIIIGSGICLWIHFATWVWSLDHTSLTHSLLFVTAHPLVIVVGMVILGKSLSPREMAGAIVGFIGAGVVLLGVQSEGDATLIGDTAAFIGAVAIVGYLAAGRVLRRWVPLFIYAFPVTVIASLLLVLSSILLEGTGFSSEHSHLEVFGWLKFSWLSAVIYLALVPGLVGHTGINGVLRYLDPLVISVAVLFEPLIGSVIGWALGTTTVPAVHTWVGGMFLIGGVILVTLGQGSVDGADGDTLEG